MRKRFRGRLGLAVLAAATLLTPTGRLSATDLVLARNGSSDYRIVLSATASQIEKRAALELQCIFKAISQVELPIIADDQSSNSHEIIVGRNRRLNDLKVPIDRTALGSDGFVIKAVGDRLLIVGGTEQGSLYGVYTFLEDYLGCHWFSASVSSIPRKTTVAVGPINDTQVPALSYREAYYGDSMAPAFAERNKLNGNASIMEKGRLGREKHRGWGYWCHTFGVQVPANKYFKSHPEYFALVDGVRRPDTQLCLTHPEVLRLVVADLTRKMCDHPEAQYWSVSQNDTGGYCQCAACQAIDKREGTPMGSLLEFINRVAAAFPDKTISTLSYQYSRRPPKQLRPAKNVLIVLCSIECDRNLSIPADPGSDSFRQDVEGWSKLTDNVFIWDYVIQFSNLVSPFPNLRTLQPNMQFFVEHHAKGMFAQGNREIEGEFAELRAYALAKLMWNPACNVDQIMNEFLAGYYGAAARPIRKYIDLLHDSLERSGMKLRIFGKPADHRQGYLSPDLVQRYDELFDEAERLAANDPPALLRVQSARMPLRYARLQLGYGDKTARTQNAERLFRTAERVGLRMFNEWSLTTDLYRRQVMDDLKRRSEVPESELPAAGGRSPK